MRNHIANGDHIRLLRYVAKNNVVDVGELRLDPEEPWRWRDGVDRLGQTRKMLEFRFVPVGEVLKAPG